MAYGDHIKVSRLPKGCLYSHHGIDIGDREVIHFTGDIKNPENAVIKCTSLHELLEGGRLEIVKHTACLEPQEVVRRAIWLFGEYEGKYSLLSQNCERIANWCKTGKFFCHQTFWNPWPKDIKYFEDIMLDYEVYCNGC